MIKAKIIAVCAILAVLAMFYGGSLYVAYNKGYQKHVVETERQAVEVVVGSHTDILVAAKEVKNAEEKIKTDTDECNYIWNFDLRKCLSK